MAKGKSLVTMTFRESDLKAAHLNIIQLIKMSTDKTVAKSTQEVFNLINARDDLPVDTGNMKSKGVVIKDKFKPSTWIMGWTTPYAKVRYYGVGQERVSMILEETGKRRTFTIGVHGIPFWDRPITANKELMIAIFQGNINKEVG